MIVFITNMQQATPVAPLTLNEGWSQITALLTHLEDGLFGAGPDNPSAFTPAMYAEVHGIAYAMCTQKLSLCPDLYRRIGIQWAGLESINFFTPQPPQPPPRPRATARSRHAPLAAQCPARFGPPGSEHRAALPARGVLEQSRCL